MNEPRTRVRAGVNYTPSHGWFHSWRHVDWGAAREDLQAIASLGADHVRILPMWEILQPNRTYIDPSAVEDVARMVAIAGEAGLGASVDVFQGHLSSFDFVPAWLTSWHRRNLFTDAEVVAAEADLVRTLDAALAGIPAYEALTLGNEVNQFADEPHPTPMRIDSAQAGAWLRTLLGAGSPRGGARRALVHAAYDAIWFKDRHPFLPAHASRLGDLTVIHSWVFNGTAQRYGSSSTESRRLAEYLIELSAAFAEDPLRGVWLQEIGAPGNVIPEDEAGDFCRHSLLNAAGCASLRGVTWWCSHDIDEGLADFPPFEHRLGLFDTRGRVKPLGEAFAEVARDLRGCPAPEARTRAIVIPVDEEDVPVSRGALGPGGSVFEAWMERARAGERPALVTSRTAEDPADLTRRGIADAHTVAGGLSGSYSGVSDPSVPRMARP
ncbi:hypothetical protein ACFQ23_01480 [Schaalia naturae]|uniref:Glycosyl hydrolase n=1 Tax=Schaalia naturae TaxID=635203 RepID=A0ABW2SLS6_9ACTO